jgi:hypothetical protein
MAGRAIEDNLMVRQCASLWKCAPSHITNFQATRLPPPPPSLRSHDKLVRNARAKQLKDYPIIKYTHLSLLETYHRRTLLSHGVGDHRAPRTAVEAADIPNLKVATIH